MVASKRFRSETALVVTIGALTIVLLAVALALALTSVGEMKQVAVDQFNQQQLILARHAAYQLEQYFNFIRQELLYLNGSAHTQYFERQALANRLRQMYATMLGGLGVFEVRRVDASGRAAFIVDSASRVHEVRGEFRDEGFRWARRGESRGNVWVSGIRTDPRYPGSRVMFLVTPTYEEVRDEGHPRPSGAFVGATVMVIDVNRFTRVHLEKVRSGRSGYGWVLDGKGVFLYHPVAEFVNRNAFEARRQLAPKISFERINAIQKEKMLAGQEGTSWFISGWHRGLRQPMKKLIAYTPVRLGGPEGNWSVAVVAPMAEVEDVIHATYVRQFSLQALILFAIILGGLTIIGYEWRYHRRLEDEVREKTRHLRESQERYRSLVESASDFIFTLDREARFTHLNPAAARFLGGEPGDFIGRSLYEVLPEEGRTDRERLAEVLASGQGTTFEQKVTLHGVDYLLSTSLIALRDGSRPQAFLAITRDITQQKNLERQLANTERLASLGLLAGGVAHEINNPIAIIMGFADLLLSAAPPGGDQHRMLKAIERQAQQCKKIVEQLLSFTRFSEAAEETTDINANLEAVLDVVGNTLLIEKICARRLLDPDLPKVKADPKELQQVFLNLINNAVAAMEGGGRLTVETRLDEVSDQVQAVIADSGCGIPRQVRDKVFDPFFTTKQPGEGTGLGLTVSYGIVTKYGGSLNFTSVTLEENPVASGTTFVVSLPAYRLRQVQLRQLSDSHREVSHG